MAKVHSPQINARIQAIAKDLASGKDRAYILGKYGKKWGISRTSIDRYIEKAKVEAKNLTEIAQNATAQAVADTSKESIINGVKTKNERIIILQNEIEKSIEDLYPDLKAKGRKKKLTVFEKVALRKVIKDLQSEISKIEGDYAETSIKLKGDKDNPLLPKQFFVINGKKIEF